LTEQWRQTVTYYDGDYYPLLPYNRDDDRWIAWQFHRPGEDAGVVEAFRRGKCEQATEVLRLGGLDPAARYEVRCDASRDASPPAVTRIPGQSLMELGLPVSIADKPGAAVIVYKAVSKD
jgi:alpha-galactosidase